LRQRVRDLVRRRARGRLAAAVTIEEDRNAGEVRVGFPDRLPGGLNPMVPVWHEFGTFKMPANPALGRATEITRAEHDREMRQAIERIMRKLE
jgi:hypothetical protein